jgi:hypothetical protein
MVLTEGKQNLDKGDDETERNVTTDPGGGGDDVVTRGKRKTIVKHDELNILSGPKNDVRPTLQQKISENSIKFRTL